MMQIDVSIQIASAIHLANHPTMKASRAIIIVAALMHAMAANAGAQTCHYELLKLGSKYIFDGRFTLNLGDSDDIYHPTAWAGPLKIRQPDGTSCTASGEISIMQRPIYTDDDRLIVSTYSGSNQTVYIVDKATCRTLWTSDLFSGEVSVQRDKLYINRKAIRLGKDCVPVKLK